MSSDNSTATTPEFDHPAYQAEQHRRMHDMIANAPEVDGIDHTAYQAEQHRRMHDLIANAPEVDDMAPVP